MKIDLIWSNRYSKWIKKQLAKTKTTKDRNDAQIIKDHNNNLYLKVELVDSYVCFKIEEYNTKPEGKIVKLSDNFLINLKGGK